MKSRFSHTRSTLLLSVLAALLGGLSCASWARAAGPGAHEALQKIVEGNKRFVAGEATDSNQSAARRSEVAKGQHPFAIVLACADSRVSPEVVLDQGLGDLFTVRVAGNIVDPASLGSFEYAVEHLQVPLLIVVGHEKCGAVAASLAGGHAPGHIHCILEAIEPAVKESRGQAGDALDNAVVANVRRVVKQLQTAEPILKEAVKSGKLKIVGARYDLDTGLIEILN